MIGTLDAARAFHVESGVKARSYALVPRSAERVLDVGSGTGDDVLAIAERLGPKALVVGLDSQLELVEEATRRARVVALNVRFAVGDAHYLPYPDGSFDVVRADGLFGAVLEPHPVLRELVRVLASGGKLLIHERESLVLGADSGREKDALLELCKLFGLESVTIADSFPWSRPGSTPREERGLSLVGTKPGSPGDRASHVP